MNGIATIGGGRWLGRCLFAVHNQAPSRGLSRGRYRADFLPADDAVAEPACKSRIVRSVRPDGGEGWSIFNGSVAATPPKIAQSIQATLRVPRTTNVLIYCNRGF